MSPFEQLECRSQDSLTWRLAPLTRGPSCKSPWWFRILNCWKFLPLAPCDRHNPMQSCAVQAHGWLWLMWSIFRSPQRRHCFCLVVFRLPAVFILLRSNVRSCGTGITSPRQLASSRTHVGFTFRLTTATSFTKHVNLFLPSSCTYNSNSRASLCMAHVLWFRTCLRIMHTRRRKKWGEW